MQNVLFCKRRSEAEYDIDFEGNGNVQHYIMQITPMIGDSHSVEGARALFFDTTSALLEWTGLSIDFAVITLLLAASDNLYIYALPFAIGGFGLTLGVSIIVFSGTLGYLEAKEKRSKEDEKDS